LQKGGKSDFFNLGSETGYSVKEMTDVAQKVCGREMNVDVCGRRPGDVDVLIADSSKIKNVLGWSPKHSDLAHILLSAWKWEQQRV
jgi:UDP-glucose 4-epimerase